MARLIEKACKFNCACDMYRIHRRKKGRRASEREAGIWPQKGLLVILWRSPIGAAAAAAAAARERNMGCRRRLNAMQGQDCVRWLGGWLIDGCGLHGCSPWGIYVYKRMKKQCKTIGSRENFISGMDVYFSTIIYVECISIVKISFCLESGDYYRWEKEFV